MSDHVDGDAPALARDAAGVRLTDEQALALARYVALGWVKGESPPSFASDTDSDKDAEMLARYVLAVAPVVAAARRQAEAKGRWREFAMTAPIPYDDTGARTYHERTCRITEAAVRALDGLGGA